MLNLSNYIKENPSLYKQIKIDDLLFAEYLCLNDNELSDLWAHTNYLVFTIKGKKGIRTQNKEYFVEQGDALFIKRGAHTTHQFFEERYLALLIFLPDNFIKEVLHKNKIESKATDSIDYRKKVIELEMDDVLYSYFYSVLSYFSQPDPPAEKLLKKKFEEFILNIVCGSKNRELANFFINLHTNSKIPLEEIMEANFQYNIKLKDFAKLSGRSMSTFRREFEKSYGITPGKWLTRRRLEYSLYLLKNTDKNVTEITYESGFENPSHFVRIFKEKYDTSPLKFKES